jgi:hypothetical protein
MAARRENDQRPTSPTVLPIRAIVASGTLLLHCDTASITERGVSVVAALSTKFAKTVRR